MSQNQLITQRIQYLRAEIEKLAPTYNRLGSKIFYDIDLDNDQDLEFVVVDQKIESINSEVKQLTFIQSIEEYTAVIKAHSLAMMEMRHWDKKIQHEAYSVITEFIDVLTDVRFNIYGNGDCERS